MGRSLGHVGSALVVLALLAGCGGDPEPAVDPGVAGTTPTPSSGSSHSPSGTLRFGPAKGGADGEVLVGAQATLSLSSDGRNATLGTHTVQAPAGYAFGRVALEGNTALLVATGTDEQDYQPQRAMLVDADTGRQRRFTGAGVITPADDGTWAMADGKVAYTSRRAGDVFCLTVAPITTLKGRTVRCGGKREGLTQARIHDGAVGFATFRQACGSLWTAAKGSAKAEPLTEAKKCRGWEVVPTDTGAVWSEIVRPHQVELGRIMATDGGKTITLGPGSTGTVTGCGDSVWWSRPPASGHGDQLMRWQPGGKAEVAYDPDSAQSPIAQLSCSDDRLSFVRLDPDGGATTLTQHG